MYIDKLKMLCVEKCMDIAISLYDGGWRSKDYNDLIIEYDLTGTEASAICACLECIEEINE